MAYIYDILLNLNNSLIEFYEWNDSDNIKYIRKIPLFKVKQEMMKDLLNYEIELNEEFVKKLKNETSFYNNIDKNYEYLCLFTDGYSVLGVKFKDNKIDLISKMQLDEEDEVLKISDKLNTNIILYKKLSEKSKNTFLTRYEEKIKTKLKEKLTNLLKNEEYEELEYYYYEYFNRKSNDYKKAYLELITSLDKEITKKHIEFYKTINNKLNFS